MTLDRELRRYDSSSRSRSDDEDLRLDDLVRSVAQCFELVRVRRLESSVDGSRSSRVSSRWISGRLDISFDVCKGYEKCYRYESSEGLSQPSRRRQTRNLRNEGWTNKRILDAFQDCSTASRCLIVSSVNGVGCPVSTSVPAWERRQIEKKP